MDNIKKVSLEGNLDFKPLTDSHLKGLASLVAADRFSTGHSILDLHSKDQSAHPACRPEAVIWPQTAEEVAAIPRATPSRSAAGSCSTSAA